MRAIGVAGKKKHRRKPRTTDSRHVRAVAPNLARLTEAPRAPDQLWVTDITYLQTGQGWLYLAAILDGWSRRVIGWACAPTLAAPLVIAALRSAEKQRRPAAGTIHHSDRGSQYTDAELLNLIDTAGLARSMSRAGNCYENAMIESFWSTLKIETGLDVLIPATRREAELPVFDYIETFYNPQRRHSSLGQISPVAFELEHQKSHIKAACFRVHFFEASPVYRSSNKSSKVCRFSMGTCPERDYAASTVLVSDRCTLPSTLLACPSTTPTAHARESNEVRPALPFEDSDLTLECLGGDDIYFHLIELERPL